MADTKSIYPEEARGRVIKGGALLVCAYESDKKFAANHLEGAMSHGDFLSRLPDLSKDVELIFYCA